MDSSNHQNEKSSLDNAYKVLIINEEDLKEVGNYKITLRRLYAYISLAILAIIAAVVCLIYFTPLKRTVPGYGKLESNAAFIELTRQISTLERQVEDQKVYTEGFRNMLDNIKTDPDSKSTTTLSAPKPTPIEGGITTLNRLQSKYLLAPVKGTISKAFMSEEGHFGIDIIAPKHSPIVAPLDGTVIQSDWSLNDGYSIGLLHDDNIITIYKHNSILLKSIGTKVKAGEAIAIIGNSGEMSDGPHLHFELWFEGQAVDPNTYIHF